MAKRTRRTLKVIYAIDARAQMDEIWEWNSERHGSDHAKSYIEFLQDAIEKLSSSYDHGRRLAHRDDLRSLLIRRSAKGHGHVAIYKFDREVVEILFVYHTAQNWRSKLPDA